MEYCNPDYLNVEFETWTNYLYFLLFQLSFKFLKCNISCGYLLLIDNMCVPPENPKYTIE